ncbi:MAG: PPC domain-containing DNA-binding protein [Candidatus Hadarchaeia archaeon]
MAYFKYNTDKAEMVSIPHGADIIQHITEHAKSEKITSGFFTAIGALQDAKIGFYDQKDHEYREKTIEEPREIANCTGNISLKNGKPFVHAHVVLSDNNYNVEAGHLTSGTVFAAEVHLTVLEGPSPRRKQDKVTDLALWKKDKK